MFGLRLLYYGTVADRPLLRQIGQGLATARPAPRVNVPAVPILRTRSVVIVEPELGLGTRSGQELLLAEDPGKGLVVLSAPGHQPELLRSTFLHQLLGADFDRTFPATNSPSVSVQGGKLIVECVGLPGQVITLRLVPHFAHGEPLGFSLGEPGGLSLAKIRVTGEHYSWVEKLALPPRYRVYRPIDGWEITLQASAVPSFKSLGAWEFGWFGFSGKTLGLTVKTSPVKTATQALATIAEAVNPQGQDFPVWPKGPGTLPVSWHDPFTNHLERGIESTSVRPYRGDFRVRVDLRFPLPKKGKGTFHEAWTVGRQGQIGRLGSTSTPPHIRPGPFESLPPEFPPIVDPGP